MGLGASKEDEDFVNDPDKIFWDDNGNLIHGKAHWMKRETQIREIMQLDRTGDEEDTVWYIMESAWVSSWLAYVHFDKDNSPGPGPCRNDRLLAWDYHQGKYVGRFGLFMAVKERAGDYRRVTKETWDKYCQLYPGSGPAITMQYKASEMSDGGLYDCSKWNVLDPPPPPENKDKKVKKRLLSALGGKKNKDKDKDKEDSDPNTPTNEESKAAEMPIDSSPSKDKTIGSSKGSGYIKLEGEGAATDGRASTGSREGLIDKDSTRQSSVAGGNKPDSYIEDVFFGKE